jgi:hypothetical protein
MRIDRHRVLREAGQKARRARRTSGRFLVCGVGFAAAYYLDRQNGRARRARLRTALRHAAHRAQVAHHTEVATSLDPGEPPPDFSPVLQALGVPPDDPRPPEHREAVDEVAHEPARRAGETALPW